MKKDNIKKLAIVVTTTVMAGGLALILNGNLDRLRKIKSSVIDPINGYSCTTDISDYDGEFEGQNFTFLDIGDEYYYQEYTHTTGHTGSDIGELQSHTQNHCPNGYSCKNKPQITPMQIDDPECTTISIDDVSYYDDNIQEQLEELYEAYNHPDFCPTNYCDPDTYEITLDSSGDFNGTLVSPGTTKIYEKFNTAFYLDEEETKEMTSYDNPITKPVMTVSVTYDANGQGASYTSSPTSVQTPFDGYYPQDYYGDDDSIGNDGYNNALDNKMYYNSSYYGETYSEGFTTLEARYTEADLTLPEISKTDHICYWNVATEKNTYDGCDYSDIVNGSYPETIYDENDSAYCIRGGRTIQVKTNVVATAMCLYRPTFTVSYNANGGSGTTASHTCVHDETCTLSSNGFSRSGYLFTGWKKNNSGSTLQPGANITNVITTGTVTYYAQWLKVDGTSKTFSSNSDCSAQTYTAPSNGTYLLEVCGAQGGGVSYGGTTENGGLGGCAKGKVSLTAGQTIYVFIGKQGTMAYGNGNKATGGCNGGGSSNTSSSSEEFVCSGGGATHISKSNSTIANAGNNLLIVGGGGGGAYLYFNAGGFDFGGNGGAGGGSSGVAGSSDTSDGTYKASGGGGGTQSSGGSVGGSKGQGGIAAGGGYYGGGAAQAQPIIGGETGKGAGAGGGSGYVGGVSSTSWTSSCSNSGNYRTGDGCAKITKQ